MSAVSDRLAGGGRERLVDAGEDWSRNSGIGRRFWRLLGFRIGRGSARGISGDEAMCVSVTASLSIERQAASGGGDGCGLAGRRRRWWSSISSACEIAAV